MSKKILVVALTAIGLSSAAFADNFTTNPGVYVGVQAGYGDTNWKDADTSVPFLTYNGVGSLKLSSKDTGLAGGILAGYNFNQYIAAETGFVYFPKTTQTVTIYDGVGNILGEGKDSFNTYGIDALVKISVPLGNNFGLFAKAGPGYLRTDSDADVENVDLVYGMGANYAFTPNVVVDASFTRFNGNHDATDDNYQPNADLYALGLTYRFNA